MVKLSERFEALNVWQRGSTRAPHKPLLVLLALGALARGQRSLSFEEVEPKLEELLKEFGPPRKSNQAEYPFWRLQNDGLWLVTADRPMQRRASNSDARVSELRAANARGEFSPDVQAELLKQPGAIESVARQVLEENFPETLHRDILDAVGLNDATSAASRRRRDPNFRAAVLVAYQYRCAMCGLDLRLGNVTVGLDAAHIKWHQAKGPDTVDNGIVFCTLHHKLFDFGAFTVSNELRFLVSEHVNGSRAVDEVLLRYHGQALDKPRRAEERPNPEHLTWHRSEVFKERALP
jgi:putative restriction endonuclease